jgi:hypothetical protein
MYVEEKDRSWCSGGKDSKGNPIRVNGISGADNDHRAVTIEVASDTTAPYAVTDKALASLIELCADVCKRNGIKQLLWKGDKSLVGQIDKQNMTVHRWFAMKSCPGDYLYERHGYIAEEVNKRLGAMSQTVGNPILGKPTANVPRLVAFLSKNNPSPKLNCSAQELAVYYLAEGQALGVRGDIAFCQACLETGLFRYGGIVTSDMQNFCGLGALNNNATGNAARFSTPQEGVRAHIQHLYAYASKSPLPDGMACVDPRFKLVTRGVAPNWEDLNGRWAVPGNGYGQKILAIYKKCMDMEMSEPVRKSPEEQTVDNALEDGILSDKAYWLNVLLGKTVPSREFIKGLLDNVHKVISK